MSRKVRLLSSMSELGAGTRGASLGFEAFRLASLKDDPGFLDQFDFEEVENFNYSLHKETSFTFGKKIDYISKVYQLNADAIERSLKDNMFPFIFTGDHSNAGGTIAGIKQHYPDKTLGVLWIDAHADLHSPYTSPTGNVHGMPLATAIFEDNLDSQINDPSPEVIANWNKMKGKSQRLKPENLVFVGVRDTETPENNLLRKYSIPNYSTAQLREMGLKQSVDKIKESFVNCDILYVSFDVDSLDSSISKGTGTPVPNGLSKNEAKELILSFLDDPRLVCLECTEINPLLDDKNTMAEAAYEILKPALQTLKQD